LKNDNADPIDWMTAWQCKGFLTHKKETKDNDSSFGRDLFYPSHHEHPEEHSLRQHPPRSFSCRRNGHSLAQTQIAAPGAVDEAPAITGRLNLQNVAAFR
jgi:hypothetical protein